jgi:hypothetical protein
MVIAELSCPRSAGRLESVLDAMHRSKQPDVQFGDTAYAILRIGTTGMRV